MKRSLSRGALMPKAKKQKKIEVYRGGPVDVIVGASREMVVTKGTVEYSCSQCEAPTFLSPSSQKLHKETGARILCVECSGLMAEDVDVKIPSLESMLTDLLGKPH
ncbi:MAG: hypothetical protein ACRD8O_15480 [Bryobacteraceae bacterium]